MTPVTARFVWTADDLITGRKHLLKLRRRRRLVLLAIAILLFVIGIRLLTGRHDPLHDLAPPVIGGMVGGLATFATLIPFMNWKIRRDFAKRPDANMEIVWEISDDGIRTSSPIANSEIKWPIFQKVIAAPVGILFMPNAQIFHFLPLRAFATPADFEEVKALAQKHSREYREKK